MLSSDISENDLLPPNATQKERELSFRAASISKLAVDIWKLWDADKIPVSFLSWLAWSVSLDSWQDNWQDNVKRQLVAKSSSDHKQKGTRAAVEEAIRRVLALADDSKRQDITDIMSYDNSFQIREWWEKDPRKEAIKKQEQVDDDSQKKELGKGHSPDFEIQLLIGRGVLGGRGLLRPELYREIRRSVDAVKPMSTRYTLSIGGAKLEAPYLLDGAFRAVRYARFFMVAQPKLNLEGSLETKGSVRTIKTKSMVFKPVPKLNLQNALPYQQKVRAVTRNRLTFQLPFIKLEKKPALYYTIRAPGLKRFYIELQSDPKTEE